MTGLVRHISKLLFVGALVFLANGSMTLAADNVAVRAGEHPDYGRIVMDWGKDVAHQASISNGALIVTFDQPFTANFNAVTRVLDDYISGAELINSGKSVRFSLRGDYALKTAKYGTALAFDLKKKSGLKPSTDQAIPVRVGEHVKYTRIVVDWPKRTDFKVSGADQEYQFSFDAPGRLALAEIQRDLPDRVQSIQQVQVDNGSSISLKTSTPTRIKSFRSGNSVVFDVITVDQPVEEEAPAAQQVVKAEPVQKTPVKKLTDNPPAKPEEQELAESEPEKVTVTKAEEAPVVEDVSAVAAPEKKENAPKLLIPESNLASNNPQNAKAPTDKLTINVANLKDGFRMIFPWEKPAAMALFERSGKFWLVFNEPVRLDFSRLSGPYKFLLIKKKQMPHPSATVASLVVREGYTPSVARVENEWRIDFRLGEALRIKNTIDIQSQPASAVGARVFIPAVNNGKKVTFMDPEAGDELTAVPLYAPGWGLGVRRTFAQFVVLPSMQGIGMYKRDSSVKMAVERNGVSITADKGLQLTREISKDDLFASGDQSDRFSGKKDAAQLVKLQEWAQVPEKEFWERKQLLQRKVARAPQGGRNAARMGLAKFFIAHKYHADAFAVLERIRKDDPRADEDGVYRLLRGLANLGLHHMDEAQTDLMHPVFNGVAEVAPWRAKVAAERDDWKTALREMKLGQEALGVYNEDLKNEFNLIAAEAALEDFDVESANKSLEKIRTSLEKGTNISIAARREYLEGLGALKSGDIERAIGKFDQVIELDYRPLTTHAKFRRVNAMLSQQEITPDEAIEELLDMSYAWRGDHLELDILKRVGDLQIAQGNIDEGLKTFRNIVMTFPKNPQARDIAREMNDLFNQLFLEGKAEDLPPVKALALYYEYRELTPLGKQGDKMIRGLADRLIKVDLLEQAAQLLDHQINFRLKGDLKALTGTKLAVVHLWNGNPQESLNVLYKTRWKALPEEVKRERLFIQARAHSDLGDYEEALELLIDEKGRQAEKLKADIYWKAKMWPKAIATLDKLLQDTNVRAAEKLNPEQRQYLMQLAVARNLSNDQSGLEAMRRTYRKKFVGSPDLDAFDLITEQPDGSEMEFRKRATAIAKVNQLESFMTGYRDQLENGEFWSTN
ncbi:hypothetical protein GUA87_15760 [Sneathiella sp. P13V-1]|uniref:tetratricopeptide repeat protein n=1 Tax=Sneathiella sp. P13V-1 TaxID=2697366 RepID=UPI00187B7A69|nr:hypothetical protein [Sneathiella sp. P13V-1]MBE7638314.1 hypothetical protein [Sneathiella sp. P13V-1]